MLKIAICEDDRTQLEFLRNVANDLLCRISCNIISYSNCNDFLDVVEAESILFDIAIIDIELGISLNGIDIAKLVNKKSTSYANHICFLRI